MQAQGARAAGQADARARLRSELPDIAVGQPSQGTPSRRAGSAAGPTTRAAGSSQGAAHGSDASGASQDAPRASATPARTGRPPARAARPQDQPRPSAQASRAKAQAAEPEGDGPELVSERVGDLRQQERARRLRASSRRYFLRILLVVGIIVALVAGWAALYNSPVFSVENVTVNGVEHLTADEMTQLANVPADTTLLRVDSAGVEERIRQNSWVRDVQVNRVFPDTLEINVTERPIAAIVQIPISQGSAIKRWAIADDHMWLMPIPELDSDAASTTSAKIYEDADAALQIVDVPYGTKADIGEICADENVNNALDIVGNMTTELAGRVVQISAPGVAETVLTLDTGVEIAFGKAEDIRDKERVILQILEDNPDGVAYINVRMVETPTWRSI